MTYLGSGTDSIAFVPFVSFPVKLEEAPALDGDVVDDQSDKEGLLALGLGLGILWECLFDGLSKLLVSQMLEAYLSSPAENIQRRWSNEDTRGSVACITWCHRRYEKDTDDFDGLLSLLVQEKYAFQASHYLLLKKEKLFVDTLGSSFVVIVVITRNIRWR